MAEKVAFILGSGMEKAFFPGSLRKEEGNLEEWEAEGEIFYVLRRHGKDHALPPHMIDYIGNIRMLKEKEVGKILATCAVGSLKKDITPGTLLCLSDFVDLSARHLTLYSQPIHTDFSQPFCPFLRELLLEEGRKLGIAMKEEGVYCCVMGPRYETPAEVKALATLGCDVVGMTIATEAILAKEAGICYSGLAVVTNYAGGLEGATSHKEVEEMMRKKEKEIVDLFFRLLKRIPKEGCPCRG